MPPGPAHTGQAAKAGRGSSRRQAVQTRVLLLAAPHRTQSCCTNIVRLFIKARAKFDRDAEIIDYSRFPVVAL
jgi:hypothetical protein